MKNLKIKLLSFSFLVLLATSSAIFLPAPGAQAAVDCGATGVNYDTGSGLCLKDTSQGKGFLGATSITDLILKLLDLLFALAAIIAVVFIVIGGYRYITSSGNEEGAKAGRSMLTNAAIGLVIIIMAYAIVTIINNTVAGTKSTNTAPVQTGGNDTSGNPNYGAGCNQALGPCP